MSEFRRDRASEFWREREHEFCEELLSELVPLHVLREYERRNRTQGKIPMRLQYISYVAYSDRQNRQPAPSFS